MEDVPADEVWDPRSTRCRLSKGLSTVAANVPQTKRTGWLRNDNLQIEHKSPLTEQGHYHLIGQQWGKGKNEGHSPKREVLQFSQLGLEGIVLGV